MFFIVTIYEVLIIICCKYVWLDLNPVGNAYEEIHRLAAKTARVALNYYVYDDIYWTRYICLIICFITFIIFFIFIVP